MAKEDKVTLKGYFQAGDKPDQGNFENLIDSQFNLEESGTQHGIGSISLTGTGSFHCLNVSGSSNNGAVVKINLPVSYGAAAAFGSGSLFILTGSAHAQGGFQLAIS